MDTTTRSVTTLFASAALAFEKSVEAQMQVNAAKEALYKATDEYEAASAAHLEAERALLKAVRSGR